MALVKADAVLSDHVQFPTKGAKGLAMYAMRMTGCMYVWPSPVYGAVNGKSRRIDGLVAVHHLAFLVHQYQIRHAYQGEMRRQWVEPEMVGEYWVAHADMAGDTFVEPARGKDAIGSREMLFTVEAFVFEAFKRWVFADFEGLARLGPAHSCYCLVVIAFGVIDPRACRNGRVQVLGRCCERPSNTSWVEPLGAPCE